jgi:hypothetical protein
MERLRLVTGWLFVISSLFPIAASLLPADPPRWLGVADVVVAALLAGAALMLASRVGMSAANANLVPAYRLVRIVAYLIPCLLAVFFLAGPRVKWEVLVIGLGWRAFLLVMVAPHLTRRASS